MFVERLSTKQFANFISKIPGFLNVKETDIKFEVKLEGQIYFTLAQNRSKEFIATDKYIINEHCTSWRNYLYSIFGEEYKNWYIKQLKNEYEMIFS